MAGCKAKGLQVKYSEDVREIGTQNILPPGWFVFVWRNAKWQALAQLRFLRKADAEQAAKCLTRAGLYTADKLEKADGISVLCIACEQLQW